MTDRINMTYSFAEDFKKDYPAAEIGLILNAKVGCSIDVFEKASTTGNGSDVNYGYRFKNVMYDFRTALGNLKFPIIAGGLAGDKPISGNNSSSAAFNDKLNAETAKRIFADNS